MICLLEAIVSKLLDDSLESAIVTIKENDQTKSDQISLRSLRSHLRSDVSSDEGQLEEAV